jgi:hypothetical protein
LIHYRACVRLVKEASTGALEVKGSAFTRDWQVARPIVATNTIKPSNLRNTMGIDLNSH